MAPLILILKHSVAPWRPFPGPFREACTHDGQSSGDETSTPSGQPSYALPEASNQQGFASARAAPCYASPSPQLVAHWHNSGTSLSCRRSSPSLQVKKSIDAPVVGLSGSRC